MHAVNTLRGPKLIHRSTGFLRVFFGALGKLALSPTRRRHSRVQSEGAVGAKVLRARTAEWMTIVDHYHGTKVPRPERCQHSLITKETPHDLQNGRVDLSTSNVLGVSGLNLELVRLFSAYTRVVVREGQQTEYTKN
jgi:hypothetical protein